jgi:hypothetical protein
MTDAIQTRVEIDLNVRVRGGQTYSGLEDIYGEMPAVGDIVMVFQPDECVEAPATVEDIDLRKELIYMSVSWSDLSRYG